MDKSSTINNRWKICTIASFTGCIALILCLNYKDDSINFWDLRTAAITMGLSDHYNMSGMNFSEPSNMIGSGASVSNREEKCNIHCNMSSMNFSEPSNMVGGSVSVRQREEKCNIFDGKWVYNEKASPLYQGHQCPFLSDQVSCQRNGRPDFDYQKWSWEAKDCKIPRFNGTDMLERLRGKRVIIVGDSLNRNQWESLACLLYSAISPSRASVDVKSGVYKVFKAKDYDCSVEFYWSPFLVQLEDNQANGSRVLRLDKLSTSAKQWRDADVMVFNTGHWWVHRGKIKAWDLFQYKRKLVEEMEIESAFETAMKTWASWIDQNVNRTRTNVFFRSISPEHKGNQWCYNETQPIMDESYESTFPKIMRDIVERTIRKMRTPVKYLNITKLSGYRKDAHSTIYARKEGKIMIRKKLRQPESFADCSHWCLPGLPDTWNNLLYASMILDTSDYFSSS